MASLKRIFKNYISPREEILVDEIPETIQRFPFDTLDAAIDEGIDLQAECPRTPLKVLQSAAGRVKRTANLKHTKVNQIPELQRCSIALSIESEKTEKNPKTGVVTSKVGKYGRKERKIKLTHREKLAAAALSSVKSFPQNETEQELKIHEFL